jgi:hypothetical protein
MRRLFLLRVLIPLRHFFVGDLLAEVAALRAQVARLEELTALVPEIESALLTLALHGDDRQKKPVGWAERSEAHRSITQ